MPDLPTPQDAAEATLFSECWDAVLSYAELCTGASAHARQLASEAFSLGIREARAAEADYDVKSYGRRARTPRLPRIPLLLTAVRQTTAMWEARGLGDRLDPELRLWLNSEKAARFSGPPLYRPLALRGLRDMQEPDAALLWLAEVEALPATAVARRLGLDPQGAAEELHQVRGVFRDRCHRNHIDTPLSEECRSYARLLDAVTRSPAADVPDDLSWHLARCVECAEAAACLRLGGGGLPAALAGGVIGWGGLAYLERRRRAVESGLSRGVADDLDGHEGDTAEGRRARIGRAGLLVAAAGVSLLALAVTLVPFGTGDGSGTLEGTAGREPVGEMDPSFDPVPSGPADGSTPSATSSPRGTGSDAGTGRGTGVNAGTGSASDKEPQGDSTSTATSAPGQGDVDPNPSEPAVCHARYELSGEWPNGFQATVTVKSDYALSSWSVSWTFPDGQRVTQMWDGKFDQVGARVTANAADYNKAVAAGGSFAVGFIGSWDAGNGNAAPDNFTLNGRSCTHS
ncbi:cellulose-binding domain-containing protein [Streptomyces sp. NBC_00878]|uniref:cellulose-binding domain-containing protein n=1 Tax=Streptomyces sp. NBC_00878 TaxID=2975854 RepID=UPI00224F2E30|nr:cellulose-binding domain-containing protein [Streptomyces sp. NBC_00878]MCX4904462.1 cellulose binding domain-containing protein [Streptomyces sp. NBC_00878]